MEKDTTETFEKKLKERFEDIEMVSGYGKDNDDKITVRCIKHDPFDDRLERDMTKNRRCKENNVQLIYLLSKKFKKLSEGELFQGIYSEALLIEDIEQNHNILLDYIKNAEPILTD